MESIEWPYQKEDGSYGRTPVPRDTTSVSLSVPDAIYADLAILSTLSNLRIVRISGTQIRGIDLSPLKQCKKLRTVELELNQIEGVDLAPLGECPALDELSLRGNQLEKLDLSPFEQHGNLRVVDFSENEINEVKLGDAGTMDALERLKISDNQLEQIDLDSLGACPRLLRIDLANNVLTEIDLSPLGPSNSLRELWLYWNNLKSINLTPLAEISTLMELRLEGNRLQQLDLSPLANCVLLKTLLLRKNQLQILDITPLFNCRYLAKFDAPWNVVLTADSNIEGSATKPPGLKDASIHWIDTKQEQTKNSIVDGESYGFPELHVFEDKILACLKERLDSETVQALEGNQANKQHVQAFFEARAFCYSEQLASMNDEEFDKLIDEMMEPIFETAEKIDDQQFSLLSKLIDPRELMEQRKQSGELLSSVLKGFEDGTDEGDPILMGRLWFIAFLNNIAYQNLITSLSPLFTITGLAHETLKLDMNWAVSVLALVLTEGAVKEKLRAFEIGFEEGEYYHILIKKLSDAYKNRGMKPPSDLLLSTGFRNIRNEVAHDPANWKPTMDEMHEIVKHTLSLCRFLFQEKETEKE